ncbi:FRG domain-containing protein [Vibrio cortegadensis]|uniref:FRG domain-containing protein n=1 Tax=Vibrio cortegadensis TaxID=1328770 RepID=A0ABV4MBY0_9VIBR
MTIKEITFSSTEQFIAHILPTNPQWQPKRIQDIEPLGGLGWIFRGQANSDWSLQPSAFRAEALRLYSNSWINGGTEGALHFFYLTSHLHAELHAVNTFLKMADNAGFTTPLSDNLSVLIERFTAKLKENSAPWKFNNSSSWDSQFVSPEFPPKGTESCFALAQHHGMPTRLLDWSSNPLIAAYFAAKEVWDGRVSSENMSLWCLNVANTPKDHVKIISPPRSSNDYQRSQKGFFTVDMNINNNFVNSGSFVPLNSVISNYEQDSKKEALVKLILPSKFAKELLRKLYLMNITPCDLMPTLDKVRETYEYHQKLFDKAPLCTKYQTFVPKF